MDEGRQPWEQFPQVLKHELLPGNPPFTVQHQAGGLLLFHLLIKEGKQHFS